MPPSMPFSTRFEQRCRQVRVLQAVRNNDISRVRLLLRNCREWDSMYLLHIRDDSPDQCCCLRPSTWSSPARQIALVEAIKLGLMDMVVLLLEAGTLVYCGEDCNSYATIAARYGQTEILQLLLERDIFHPTEKDGDLVQHAFRQENLPMIRVLMEYRRLNPESALEIAAKGGHESLVKALNTPSIVLSFMHARACAIAAGIEGHIDLMKYFVAFTRLSSCRISIAREVFQKAATIPVLEYCMTLCDPEALTPYMRRAAFIYAMRRDRVDVAEFHVRHGAIVNRFAILRHLERAKTEESFLFAWNLVGGTSNMGALSANDPEDNYGSCHRLSTPAWNAAERGFWGVFEMCLDHPEFKMGQYYQESELVKALERAGTDNQERVFVYLVEKIPKACQFVVDRCKFFEPHSPLESRMILRGRQMCLLEKTDVSERWMYSDLPRYFVNLMVHYRLRPLESIISPIGLPPDIQEAAILCLRRICLFTMRLIADGNKDKDLRRDLRNEIVVCTAMPNCHTIPKLFAEQVCTQALEMDDDLLFSIIRDALIGPTYPDGGYFHRDNTKIKERWLAIVMKKGHIEVVRSLVPLSPAENVALKHKKISSARTHVSIRNLSLWLAAAQHAIANDDFVMLDILKSTQYTFRGQGGHDLSFDLLQKAFGANHRGLLRYLGQSGVDYANSTFLNFFDYKEDGLAKGSVSPLDAECAFLGIPEIEESTKDEEVSNQMEDLTDDATFIPYSSLLSDVSCGGNPHVATNYTTLVFNACGHAMCGGCLRKRFKLAKRVRTGRKPTTDHACEDMTDSNDDSDEDPKLDTGNLRVGCRKTQPDADEKLVSRAFPATGDMKRVHYREAVKFLEQEDAYLYMTRNNTQKRYPLIASSPPLKGFEAVKIKDDSMSDYDDPAYADDSDSNPNSDEDSYGY
ncbi:hypothetical protein DFS34DRAFT_598465 [Phlyctochytrium arcticum]|nr:hypothetical protein DFS34DRAFT_598465 [Phlyctochytrium arcticum]